jgi:glycine cleavage system H protein
MMGEFKANFPTDRLYASNHMWGQVGGDKVRFGFTAYAVRLLQDVYFLDWLVEAPFATSQGREIGSIESKKAESSLYAPIAGHIVEFNELLMNDPSAINTDKYGQGWLFEMTGSKEELMSPAAYVEHLDAVWAKTQRTIKGQLNE